MNNHPVSEIMAETISKIRELVDVNTIVGQAITTPDGITLIPVSKVTFGFGTGGGDYSQKDTHPQAPYMFAGGGGAGVNITPVAFLVIAGEDVRLISVTPPANTTVDRLVELVPGLIEKIERAISKKGHTEE